MTITQQIKQNLAALKLARLQDNCIHYWDGSVCAHCGLDGEF